MTTVARLKDNNLLLKNEVDENIPIVTNGLIKSYPFDGNLNKIATTLQGIKVLGKFYVSSHFWYDWFNNNTNLTNTTNILNISVSTALTYDLILIDSYVYDVTSSEIDKLKEFVDAGVSCIATGNDTTNTIFTTFNSNTVRQTHNIIIDSFSPIKTSINSYSGGSGDTYNGFSSLKNGAIPYYKRDDTNEITGFTYTSKTSGASLYYDREGLSTINEFNINGWLFAYNTSKGNIINTNTTFTENGIAVESPTENIIPLSKNRILSNNNTWGTYNVNQYNSNTYFSIGTIDNITNNIVTLSTVDHTINTYDVLNPETTGGGVTEHTNYFIRKLSDKSFTLHSYISSQDGHLGFDVYDNIKNDIRVPINNTNFPLKWFGFPHQPNSGLVKEIIYNGFNYNGKSYNYLRLHNEHRRLNGNKTDFMAYGVYPSVIVDEKYSFSFFARAANSYTVGHNLSLSFWTTNGWSKSGTFQLTKEWKRYKVEDAPARATGNTNLYFQTSTTEYNTIDIALIQCEHKTYTTSFVDGNRNTQGNLEININRLTEGTIVGSFIPDSPMLDSVSEKTPAQAALIGLHDLLHNGQAHYRFYLSPTNNNKSEPYFDFVNYFNTNDPVGNPGHYHHVAEYQEGIEVFYFIKRTADRLKIHLYQNGWKSEINGRVPSDSGIDKITFGDSVLWSGQHKKLSIYNRILTTDEINKIVSSSTLSITENGDIKNEIIEKPIIPIDATYFDLGFNSKSENKLYKPDVNINTAYENESVWVGTSTTNLLYDSNNNIDINVIKLNGSGTAEFKEIKKNNIYQIITNQVNQVRLYVPLSNLINNKSYNLSLKYRIIKGNTFYMSDWCDTTLYNRVEENYGEYNFISAYGTRSTYDNTFHFMDFNITSDAIVEIWDIQLEQSTYYKPFINGTRGDSSLSFNLAHTIYDLEPTFTDFSSILNIDEGTIACVFKPTVGFFSSSYDHPSVFSIKTGVNQNVIQVFRGTSSNLAMSISNNSNNPQTSWYSCQSANLIANNYYYIIAKWSFINNRMSLTVNNVKNQQSLSSTYKPSVKGKLSIGYDPYYSRPSNSFIKDFMIFQREITDDESTIIYNTKMKQYKNIINISNNIIEGEVL